MTPCNYCSLQRIRKRAKQNGMKVVKMPSRFMGGVEVFVVPPEITSKQIRTWAAPSDELPNGDENWQKYHRAWLMSVSKSCCC